MTGKTKEANMKLKSFLKTDFKDGNGDVQIPTNFKYFDQPSLVRLVGCLEPDLRWLRNAVGKSQKDLSKKVLELQDELEKKQTEYRDKTKECQSWKTKFEKAVKENKKSLKDAEKEKKKLEKEMKEINPLVKVA